MTEPIAPREYSPSGLIAPLLGAIVGALVLGIGGRLAMRGITLWEDRARQFTLDGTIRVILFGAAFGAAAALLRLAIDALFRRFFSGAPEKWRTYTFAIVCMALALTGLTPLTIHRLVLFPPVIAIYVVMFESLSRRTYARRGVEAALNAPSITGV